MLSVHCHRASGIVFFAFIIWWIQPHREVACNIFGEENSKSPETIHYCVDISPDESLCSIDPIVTLESVHSKVILNAFNAGVAQTIDGTEDEKNSIRSVLTQMNEYWYNEILSNFEYDEARAAW